MIHQVANEHQKPNEVFAAMATLEAAHVLRCQDGGHCVRSQGASRLYRPALHDPSLRPAHALPTGIDERRRGVMGLPPATLGPWQGPLGFSAEATDSPKLPAALSSNFGWLCLATPCEASGVDVNLMPQVDIRWYMRFEERAAQMRTIQLEAISSLRDRFPAPAAR